MKGRKPLSAVATSLLLASCALFGPRPGPPPDAPTESALSAAPPPPDVCRVSPDALRRVGPVEAGTTTFAVALARLGRPPAGGRADRACWLVPGSEGVALFAHAGGPDQPLRSLALSDPGPDAQRSCATTTVIPLPLSVEAGLRPGMAREEVERILGPITVDAEGGFGKECCGLEQTGLSERGPVYEFGCSAVLGAFSDGKLASLLVSRYAPPAATENAR